MKVWLRQLRHGVPANDIVAAISERLRTAIGQDRYELASQLDPFLVIANREHELLSLLDQMMEEFPDDVRLPMRKAVINLYSMRDLEEAFRWIDVALERAYRSGSRRREVLGYKARILLELRRGDELSDVLEEMMSLRMTKGVFDIGRERDFIDRAPIGLIRKDVLERYNEFRPKRADDSSAGEPPKYEAPDDTV